MTVITLAVRLISHFTQPLYPFDLTGAGVPTPFTAGHKSGAEARARELNANGTSWFLLGIQAKQTGFNFPHSGQSAGGRFLRAGREQTSACLLLLARLICCRGRLAHLLHSISSSVTSADYLLGKQAAARRCGAIILRGRSDEKRSDVTTAEIGKKQRHPAKIAHLRARVVNVSHADEREEPCSDMVQNGYSTSL